jgi:hypothetical protein
LVWFEGFEMAPGFPTTLLSAVALGLRNNFKKTHYEIHEQKRGTILFSPAR